MKSALPFALRTLHLVLCLLLLYPPQLALAAGVTASGGTGTTVAEAKNGVPVVNIATANGAGLSHNTYTSYNVDSKGLVLNNVDSSQLFRQSQLAGQVASNPNLTSGAAKIILNEVVANNPSLLAGYTEVLGGKADVIVANPFGITCNGCGFLNTDRASLVTGTPNINGGSLTGFNVTGGTITVSGTGLNANAQQVLDLVARGISIDGQVNAKTLNMVAGRNLWDYATGAATSLGAASGAPAYAVDTSILGGMYAGRISLKATESGVGVRMLGEAAATSDDFTITSAGAIEVRNKLSAARDMVLASSTTGGGAITLVDANLSAVRNLDISASGGAASFTGGGIVAGNNLSFDLASLADSGSATAGITDANKRYAGGRLRLASTGLWSLNSTPGALSYGAGGALAAVVGSFTLGGTGGSLYAGSTLDLDAASDSLMLNGMRLKSGADMTLTSRSGLITVGSGAGEGIQATAGNILLTSAMGLANAGTITADAGDLTIRSGGAVSDTGTINALGAVDIANLAGTGGVMLTLDGGKILGGTSTIKATNLTLKNGASLESTGDMTLSVSGGLAVGTATDSASRIVAASRGAATGLGTGDITVATSVTNYGLVFSGRDLRFSTPALFNLSTGGVSALRDLNLTVSSTLSNQGQLYAGRDLTASSSTFINDGTISAALGTINAGRNISITASSFTNSGGINANGDITISADVFTNEVKGGDTRTWGATYGYDREYTGGWADSCNGGWDSCYDHWFKDTWYQRQEFSGGTPTFSPYIYGAGTLTIKDFSSAANTFGRLSADTITLTGKTGSTFTNTSLPLAFKTYTQIWEHYYENWFIGSGPNNWIDHGTTVDTDTYPQYSYPSYIRANTLNASGFSLVNSGSPYTATPTPRSASGTSFAGLSLTLPNNPNGLFVTSQSPGSSYLVESNPLYTDLNNFLGSDYLEKTYNLNTDKIIKRLGDSGYETYLVGQQLSTMTGGKLLSGHATEKAQMQALMDSAGAQAKSLGLTYGAALSASQQANLKEDMVWMVATVVNGQTVLAPVVYLSAATKSLFAADGPGGAVIAARNVDMNLASVTNTGGSIAAAQSLTVSTQGDITNISGSITGGNAALTSTGGSIVNTTLAETTGGDGNMRTEIGRTGTISATGGLALGAAQDIRNVGAAISAGGDASLSAGRNVVLDTIENKSATSGAIDSGSTTTRTTRQVGASLGAGGNLAVRAGNDVTLAGADVSAGGGASIDAANNLNILARSDSTQTVTQTKKEGWGVGGGVYGSEKTTSDHLKTTAVGTGIRTGGAMSLGAGQTATLEGARLSSGGDTSISAVDVRVMAAKEIDTTTTTKETTTFLSLSSGESSASGAESKSIASKGVSSASAGASAGASSEKDLGGIDFKKTTTKTDTDTTVHSVGSTIASGGKLNITGKKDITLQGASVSSGGDTTLAGGSVNVLAAQDIHTTSSTTKVEKVGLYLGTSNEAGAGASASAGASATPGSAVAAAGAEAKASAKTSNNIDFVRSKSTETTTTDVTNTGTSLASGGTLKITGAQTLTVQGSDLSGDKGVDLQAKDMKFLAAQDTHDTTTTTSSSATGLYVDGKADAQASAKAGASASLGANAGASAEAGAKADLSIGVQNRNTKSSSSEGSSTARVASITSKSGSITRTAENSITDVGTAIDATGDFSQSAKTISSRAAANTTYSSSSRSADSTKVGVYAKAEAGVSAQAGAQAGLGGAESGSNVEATAKVGAGLRASHSRSEESSSSSTSEAVVSTIRTGGKVSSTSSGVTSLEGTQISGGKGVELSADSLDYSAARNTSSSSSSSGSVAASASVGVSRGTGKGVEVDLSASTSNAKDSSSSSTAVVGGITSGGGLVIKTKGDTRLEGTALSATGDTTIDAGGDVKMDAARNTASSSSSSTEVSAGFSLDKKQGGGEKQKGVSASAEVNTSSSQASSSQAVAGSIGTGGKLTISSGKSASFEGTNIASGGDASISAKDSVTMSAAKSTSSSESTSVGVGVDLGGSKSAKPRESSTTKSAGASVDVAVTKESATTAVGGSVASGGNLKISSGKDANFEGTDLSAGGKASIASGGSVNFRAAESTSESSSVGVSVSGKAERTTVNKALPAKAAEKPAARNPGTGGTQGSDGSKQGNEDLAKWQDKQAGVVQQLKDRGPSGKKGDTPEDRNAGPKGKKGDTPEDRNAGPKGKKGDTPEDRNAGPKGKKGDTPEDRNAGPKEKKGDTPEDRNAGPKEKKGDTPEDRNAGPKGKKGDTPEDRNAGPKEKKGDTPQDRNAGPKDKKGDTTTTAKGKQERPASNPAAGAGGAAFSAISEGLEAMSAAGSAAASGAGAPAPGIGASAIRDAASGAKGVAGSAVGRGLGAPVEPGVSATKTSTSASASANVQTSKSSTQQAGSIRAGAGGVEITASGGDVNLVGTGIGTSGDAAISASRDVNITAAKDSSSSLGVAAGLSSETVSKSSKRTGAVGSSAKKPGNTGGTGSSDVTENTMGVDGVAGGEWSRTSNPEDGAGAASGVPNLGARSSDKSKGAEIQTGGRTVITSGGKTTLVNTSIKADEGESVSAGGGVERKSE